MRSDYRAADKRGKISSRQTVNKHTLNVYKRPPDMQRKIEKNRADNHNLEVTGGGFDAIGDVAIIKPSKNLKLKRIKLLANSIMRKNKHIRGVFRKIGKIEGTERVQRHRTYLTRFLSVLQV